VRQQPGIAPGGQQQIGVVAHQQGPQPDQQGALRLQRQAAGPGGGFRGRFEVQMERRGGSGCPGPVPRLAQARPDRHGHLQPGGGPPARVAIGGQAHHAQQRRWGIQVPRRIQHLQGAHHRRSAGLFAGLRPVVDRPKCKAQLSQRKGAIDSSMAGRSRSAS
jgi:hypothetical protein